MFVGRDAERRAVAAAAERARGGRAQVVVVDGPAGTGKTSLVRHIVDDLDGEFAVAWAEADELSMDASFSLLSQYAPIAATSPFTAGLELIEHLGTMYPREPVALVAEDLHWADAASRGALLTAARRLRHDPVLMIVTMRPDTRFDDWDRFVLDPARCLRVVLGGLDDDDVAELAQRHGVRLSRSHASRLRQHTQGHPLHLRTLLHELSPDQLQSSTGALPAPRSLAAVTVAALATLPPPSRELVSALAVLGVRTPLATVATVAGVEDPTDALEPLLATELVRWTPSTEGTPIEFVHPLYRSAVYEDLAPRRRRDLHVASAEVTRWGPSWAHRVAAADGADDALADELEAGAHYETARSELAVAAMYLSWAATLSSSREQAEERLLLGARLLINDGQTARAAALYPRIALCAETALRDLVVGMLRFAQADATTGERFLRNAVRLPGERWVHADAHGHLASLYSLVGRPDAVVEAAEAALELGPLDDPFTDHNAWWGLAVGIGMTAGAPAGLARLAPRLSAPAAEVESDDGELLGLRGMLQGYAGRTAAGIADIRTAIKLSGSSRTFRQLPRAHLALVRQLITAGAWDEALAHARTALSLLDERHVWMRSQADAAMVPVLAARGELELAARHVAAASAAADDLGTLELEGGARIAAACLARAKGDPHGIIDALGPIVEDGTLRSGAMISILAWWPMMTIATIDSGDLDAAASQIEHFESTTTTAGLDATTHVAEQRGRLAVATNEPDEATAWFERAVASLHADHPVLERALLHHAFGRLLRARGNRRAAHDQLRSAHELLARLGAEVFLQSVVDDLGSWAGQEGRQAKRSPLALTARERDVVALVNKGLTNKEVGAQLYISAKAVEYHLGNVYGKLGVRSRRQLRDAVPTV